MVPSKQPTHTSVRSANIQLTSTPLAKLFRRLLRASEEETIDGMLVECDKPALRATGSELIFLRMSAPADSARGKGGRNPGRASKTPVSRADLELSRSGE